MEGGVLYEHSHRMIAGTVGILTLILAIWIWRRDHRHQVRRLAVAAVLLVFAQASLGGITVLYRLPVVVSVAHACLGQIFFCVTVAIAALTAGPALPHWPAGKLSKLQRLGLMTLGFIFFQLVAGATLRHTGRTLHVHFLGAFLVTVHIPLLAKRVFSEKKHHPELTAPAMILPLLLVIQLILGYISWRTGPVIITTAHVGIGALLFAGTAFITLQAFRPSAPTSHPPARVNKEERLAPV
jgi:cytochrome c oxidase assembly protein subunit 15